MKKLLIINFIVCLPILAFNQQTPEIKNIALYLQENVEILDFAGPMEVFIQAGFDTYTVAKTKEPFKAMGALTVIADYTLEDCPTPDILSFYGGGNAMVLSKDKPLIDWIKEMEAKTDILFSVCSGAFFLGEAGFLKDLTATTFHTLIDPLAERFPDADVRRNVRFVDNGNLITTAGISAGIDGALHLVSKIKGAQYAAYVAEVMEYDKWIPNEGLIFENPLIKSIQTEGFDRAIKKHKNSVVYKGELLNLSTFLLEQERIEEAEKCIRLVIKEFETNSRDFVYWGKILNKQGKFTPPTSKEFQSIIKEKGFDEAKNIYAKVVSRYPDWILFEPMDILNLAYMEFFRYEKYDSTLELLEFLMQQYPEYPFGHYWLGRTYEEKGDLPKAIQAFQNALKHKQDYEAAQEKIEELSKEVKGN